MRRSKNKLNAVKVVVDGETFDSKKEAERYKTLLKMQEQGAIHSLQRQVYFELIPRHIKHDGKVERACAYFADFMYVLKDGRTVVEDVKGYRKGATYNTFVIKRKLMLDRWGVEVEEI